MLCRMELLRVLLSLPEPLHHISGTAMGFAVGCLDYAEAFPSGFHPPRPSTTTVPTSPRSQKHENIHSLYIQITDDTKC